MKRMALVLVVALGCAKGIKAPSAVAAAPAAAAIGDSIVFDGSKSSDPQGLPLTFAWALSSVPPGSRATLNDATQVTPSLKVDLPGTYTAVLVVSNGALSSAPATVSVVSSSCHGNPPSVSAVTLLQEGAATTAPRLQSAVSLAAVVQDPDNGAVCDPTQTHQETFTYAWAIAQQPPGSTAKLNSAASPTPSFVPDLPGNYQISLVVTDSTGRSSTVFGQSAVASSCGGNVPQVLVTSPQLITVNGLVVNPDTGTPGSLATGAAAFTAQATDADNDSSPSGCNADGKHGVTFTYSWSFVSIPAGSHAQLNGSALQSPSFAPDVSGDYYARVVVAASNGKSSAPVTARMHIAPCAPGLAGAVASSSIVSYANGATTQVSQSFDGTGAPAAAATFQVGSAIQLQGSTAQAAPGSCDAGSAISYTWVLAGAPGGSTAALFSGSGGLASFTPDQPGDYRFVGTGTDAGGLWTRMPAMTVHVGNCGTLLPAGAPVVSSPGSPPMVGDTLQFSAGPVSYASGGVDVTASYQGACVGTNLRYQWTLLSAPAGSRAALSNPTGATAGLVIDQATASASSCSDPYVAQVTVTDAAGRSYTKSVTAPCTLSCGNSAPSITAIKVSSSIVPSSTTQVLAVPVTLQPTWTDADLGTACAARQSYSFGWTLLSAPAGSSAAVQNPASQSASITLDKDTAGAASPYQFSLTIAKSNGKSATATTAVQTLNCGLDPLVATASAGPAGLSQSATSVSAVVSQGQTVQLRAFNSVSATPAACAALQAVVSYRWAFTQLPFGSGASLNSATVQNPSFTADVPGTYALTLTEAVGPISARATVQVQAESGISGQQGPFSATAIDPVSGQPVVAFYDNTNNVVGVYRCTSNCTSFTQLIIDPNVGSGLTWRNDHEGPRPLDLKIDGNGNIFLAYFKQNSCGIAFATFPMAQTTRPAVAQVENGAGCAPDGSRSSEYGRWLSVGLTPAGTPMLAYSAIVTTATPAPASNIRVATCPGSCSSAAAWSKANATPLTDNTFAGWPTLSLASLPTGVGARLAFSSGYNASFLSGSGTPQYEEQTGGGGPSGWSAPVVIDATAGDLGRYISMDAIKASGPRLAYRDESNGLLKFASCDSSCATATASWTAAVIDGPNSGRFSSLAIDSNDDVLVAYRDSGTGFLKLAYGTSPGALPGNIIIADNVTNDFFSALSASKIPSSNQHIALGYAEANGTLHFLAY